MKLHTTDTNFVKIFLVISPYNFFFDKFELSSHYIRGKGNFGAGQLGAMPFRRRTFYFSSYEEKTMKQATP